MNRFPKMSAIRYENRSSNLLAIYQHALEAADPAACIDRHMRLEGQNLHLKGQTLLLPEEGRLILLAVGKASIRMAQAAARILGPRLTKGIVVSPSASDETFPNTFQLIIGGHPVPTQGSLTAGMEAQRLLSELDPQDVVLVLISGGGSALLEIPKPGISLKDLQSVNQSLLRSGAPIDQVNSVRKTLSLSKGGGLARLAAPAQVVGLILSDVVGDRLEAIASGPTVPEKIDPARAGAVLRQHGLWDELPYSARHIVDVSQSPSKLSRRPINIIVGSNRLLVEAAVDRAAKIGFEPASVGYELAGEARQTGEAIGQELLDLRPGACLIHGGETTVTIRGDGLGGRNQELALAAATSIAGADNVALLSAASDGVDGPTDAAGAWVDGNTIAGAQTAGLNAADFLNQNDSYTLLDRLGCLIKTGPSGTNVNDLVVGFKYAGGG